MLGPGPLPPAEPVVPTPVVAATEEAAVPLDEGVDLEAGPQLPLLDPEAPPVVAGPPDTDLRGRDEALGPALPVGQTPP